MIIKWTKAEDDFLHECCEKHLGYKEMAESIMPISGNSRTEYACRKRCYQLGIKNNRDMTFKSNERRQDNINTLPKGTIRVCTSRTGRCAYIKVNDVTCNNRTKGHSIGNNSNWMPYAQYVWEKKNGKIPEEYSIVHLNGDSMDNDIDNLAIAPMKVIADMARNKMFYKDKEATTAAIKIAELDVAIYGIIKNRKDSDGQLDITRTSL